MPTTDSKRRPNNAHRVRGSQEMLQLYTLMQAYPACCRESRSTTDQGRDKKSKKAFTESGTSSEASRTVMERKHRCWVNPIVGRAPKTPQDWPAKSSNSMPTPAGSKIAIKHVGCREWRRESHTRVPQTNLPAGVAAVKVVEEGRKSEYLGIMPRMNRRDQQRCC
jgi:hypothetical protein